MLQNNFEWNISYTEIAQITNNNQTVNKTIAIFHNFFFVNKQDFEMYMAPLQPFVRPPPTNTTQNTTYTHTLLTIPIYNK